MVTDCPNDAALVAYIDAGSDPTDRAQLEAHIDACPDCRELIAALARKTDAPARSAVTHERYEIIEQIGAGAMGAVYLARDTELDRNVALKILHPNDVDVVGQTVSLTANHPGLADRERLRDEARALAKLSHPNIVQIYDVGELDGEVFIAMELVVGTNLREWLAKDSPRPWREIVEVFEAAGRGLAAAHGAGIVHRDFKPDNVLVADSGRVTVTDFGLAKQSMAPGALGDDAGDDIELTSAETIRQDSTVAGTPAYMAPELFVGRPADAASDQYSFCVALHEALYNQRPSVGGPELTNDGNVPRWLHAIVTRGLHKNSKARFPDLPTLLACIDRGRRGRRRLRIGAVLVIATAAVIGTTLWVGSSTRSSTTAPSVDAAPTLAMAEILTELTKAGREKKKRKTRAAMARLNRIKPFVDPPKTKPEKVVLARILSLRCRLWRRLKNRTAAIDDCLRAIALNSEARGATHTSVIKDSVTCALYLTAARRWPEAEKMIEKAMSLTVEHRPLAGNVFMLMNNLGHVYNKTKRPQLAVDKLTAAVRYYEAKKLKFASLLVIVYDRLARAQLAVGNKQQALASARRALQVSVAKTPKVILDGIRKWIKVNQ